MCRCNEGCSHFITHNTFCNKLLHVCASFATNIALVIGDEFDTLQNVPILHVRAWEKINVNVTPQLHLNYEWPHGVK